MPPGYVPDDFGGLPAELVTHGPCRVYASADYILWWIRGDRVPALVTTGPDDGSVSPASLGRPGTVILAGNGTLDPAPRSGVRAEVGFWCDDGQCLGFETGFFILPQRSRDLRFVSDGTTLLARPFFRINPGPNFGESTEVAVRAGQSTGSIDVRTSSELFGVEPNVRYSLCRSCTCECCSYRLDLLAGGRYLQLNENLQITEDLNVIATNVAPALPNGGRAFVFDQFHTRNQFYGGQLGLSGEASRGPWSIGVEAKVALGGTHQVVDINGSQLLIDNQLGPQRFQGGLLALPTNIGRQSRERFAVVPEIGLKAGYQVTKCLRLTLGYDFLWWSSVVRPGEQIDRGIDSTRIPNFITNDQPTGQRRPAPLFQATDFWAQGLSVGLEIRF
jgi:hypothetical protein